MKRILPETRALSSTLGYSLRREGREWTEQWPKEGEHINFWVETDALLVGQGPGKSERGYWRQGGLGKEMDL